MQWFEIEMHRPATGETFIQHREAADPESALNKFLRKKWVARTLLDEQSASFVVRNAD